MDTTFLTTNQYKLVLPQGIKDQATLYVQKQAGESARAVEGAPFRRMVDFWIMAIVYAVSKRLQPSHHDGEAFVSIGPTSKDVKLDSAIKELLVLVAVWHLRPTRDSVPSAGVVVDICNRLAGAGAPALLAELKGASSDCGDFLQPHIRLAKVIKQMLPSE
jgi:hypothetical protein